MGEADRLEGLARRQGRVAEEVAGEGEVLLRRERRFQGIAVADVVQAFGQGPLAGVRRARIAPAAGLQAPGQDVEQGGFAGAVAAGDHQGLAGLEGERDALEDAALSPLAGQIVNAQTQTPRPLP